MPPGSRVKDPRAILASGRMCWNSLDPDRKRIRSLTLSQQLLFGLDICWCLVLSSDREEGSARLTPHFTGFILFGHLVYLWMV